MGPQTAALAVIAEQKAGSYPSSFIVGIITEPMEVASGTVDPEIPLKNMLATTFTKS